MGKEKPDINPYELFIKKLNKAEWKYEIVISEESGIRIVQFHVPKERESEILRISERSKALPIVANSNITDYKYMRGFEAIWSPSLKKIECEVESDLSYRLLESIHRVVDLSNNLQEDKEERVNDEDDNVKNIENVHIATIGSVHVDIRICSKEFRVLTGLKTRVASLIDNYINRLTIRISNVEVKTHDDAQKTLIKISNALFFQLNEHLRFPVTLKTERPNKRRVLSEMGRFPQQTCKINGLKFEYDDEPMLLFIYGKKATDSPLNQFLNYYQCIEYYFPIYANAEAKLQIQRILKNPSFNPCVDANITQILSVIKMNRSNEIGDERKQLETAIRSCVDEAVIKDFLISDEKRKEFYEKNLGKKLSSQIINLSAKSSSNIIKEVSDRIYDIRCRIVHKKANENLDGLILPYSPEVQLLKQDTELVEFIAKNVLIENSRPIRI